MLRYIQYLIRGIVVSSLLVATISVAKETDSHPFKAWGDAIEVRSFAVPEGKSRYPDRRARVIKQTIDATVAEKGSPLLIEQQRNNTTLLMYRDALVVVTTYYSGRVCRIDFETDSLRNDLSLEEAIVLAARSCRKAEEVAWNGKGHTPLVAIGSESIPGLLGATADYYITDQFFSLFPSMVRQIEVENKTTSVLVRERTESDGVPGAGQREWRYAWFADGTIVAAQHHVIRSGTYRQNSIGTVCAVRAPAQAFPELESGPFVDWCDKQSTRLTAGIDSFVTAVKKERSRRWQEKYDAGEADLTPSMYPGFHFGYFPEDIVGVFWKTGNVDRH